MALERPTTPSIPVWKSEWHKSRGFSCVYCWHHHSYHQDGPCTATIPTTEGDYRCDCQSFYHRDEAMALRDTIPGDNPWR